MSMSNSPFNRTFAALLVALNVLNTTWALSLPQAAHPPRLSAVLIWALSLAASAMLYWFEDRARLTMGVAGYLAAQTVCAFLLGASGCPFGATLATFIVLTFHAALLTHKRVSSVVVTIAGIATFAAASMLGSTLYQGAQAAVALVVAAIIGHVVAAARLNRTLPAPAASVEATAAAAAPRQFSGLTEREAEVLRALSRGARTSDIAAQLGIAERTVKSHLTHIYQKLGVTTRTQAVAAALSELGPTGLTRSSTSGSP
jgi:DNA-binding CsgD family transcriptional regulator